MALSGLHVACGYAGGRGFNNITLAVFSETIWSETMASADTTTNVAPALNDVWGQPVFRVQSSVDAWVAIGPTPDPVNGPRQLVSANESTDLFAQPNDRLAWVAA